MSFYPSLAVAYGAAHGRIVASLIDRGAESRAAHEIASEILNDLQRDGWKWRYREYEPVAHEHVTPAAPPSLDELRAKLAETTRTFAARDDKVAAS